MKLEDSDQQQAFRHEVRAFIAEHLPADLRRAQRLTPTVFSEPEIQREWHQALFKRGWIAPGWPVELGGTGWGTVQRFIFDSECAAAGAPMVSPSGLRMVGPVLMGFGSEAQKRYYLPRMLSGEDYWCQGYSEPGSGSDLASLKTRAVRDGSDYLVNGSKIWTTHAHHANRMFALVRTDDNGRKQEGISFLLIDMDSPGITVRPIRTLGGEHEINQVFFDDVRVPQANRVGDEGAGWRYGKYLLEFERGGSPASGRLRHALQRIVDEAQRADDGQAMADPLFVAELSRVDIDIEALAMTELRVMSALQTGENPGPISSLLKLRASQLEQEVSRLGLSVIGSDALPWEAQRPLYALDHEPLVSEAALPLVSRYLNSRAYTIFGGSSEIQHEILAKTLCGL